MMFVMRRGLLILCLTLFVCSCSQAPAPVIIRDSDGSSGMYRPKGNQSVDSRGSEYLLHGDRGEMGRERSVRAAPLGQVESLDIADDMDIEDGKMKSSLARGGHHGPVPTTAKRSFIYPLDYAHFGPFDATDDGGSRIYSELDNEVKAADSGTVIYVGKKLKHYTNLIIIDHGDDYMTTYANLSKINVSVDKEIKRGDVVGELNYDSKNKYSFLFSVRHKKVILNPEENLKGE